MMEWALQKGIVLEWHFASVNPASFSRPTSVVGLLLCGSRLYVDRSEASSSRTEFTDPSTPRLKLLEKSELFVEGNMEQETFPSLTVDINSPTPYTDANRVEPF